MVYSKNVSWNWHRCRWECPFSMEKPWETTTGCLRLDVFVFSIPYPSDHNYNYIAATITTTTTLRCLQPLFDPSMNMLCDPSFTARNLLYFAIFDTSATALCGTTGYDLLGSYMLLFSSLTYVHCSLWQCWLGMRFQYGWCALISSKGHWFADLQGSQLTFFNA